MFLKLIMFHDILLLNLQDYLWFLGVTLATCTYKPPPHLHHFRVRCTSIIWVIETQSSSVEAFQTPEHFPGWNSDLVLGGIRLKKGGLKGCLSSNRPPAHLLSRFKNSTDIKTMRRNLLSTYHFWAQHSQSWDANPSRDNEPSFTGTFCLKRFSFSSPLHYLDRHRHIQWSNIQERFAYSIIATSDLAFTYRSQGPDTSNYLEL